jgi:hypothetical protein
MKNLKGFYAVSYAQIQKLLILLSDNSQLFLNIIYYLTYQIKRNEKNYTVTFG